MKEFKGTHGLWHYEHDNDVHWDGEDETYWEYFTICDENGDYVAQCDDENDAKFIVTAPELLESLQDIITCLDKGVPLDEENCGHEFDKARAAIAKALGETK